jgi:hypothetical protein
MALGARDRANMSVRTKNIFLAKIRDSESATAPLTTLRYSHALSSREQCVERESKKMLRYKRFLQSRQMRCRQRRHFSHRDACASSRRRMMRTTSSRAAASTLP